MRRTLLVHVPTVSVFAVLLLVGVVFGVQIHGAQEPSASPVSIYPLDPVPLPAPEEDRDLDGYGDDVDRIEGDALVRLDALALETGRSSARPYLLIGTQDDQYRLGEGRSLEWRHVVDPDPLDLEPGSQAWSDTALRTGLWLRSLAADDEPLAIAETGNLTPDAVPAGTEWPQSFLLNVRDDQDRAQITVELWDSRWGRDARLASWTLHADLRGGWTPDLQRPLLDDGEALTLRQGSASLRLAVTATADLSVTQKQALADAWAPRLYFAADESFFPTRGEALESFHGFARQEPDLRTWTRAFNNDRDSYRLFIGDFDGDGDTDHQDVVLMTGILRGGELATDTVYANVLRTTGDRVVVQFWFIYIYNFVIDEVGQDVETLAHAGDREFIQLTFSDLQDALDGTPESIAYSQHYKGVRLDGPDAAELLDGGRPSVYVARGSHASYPVPGDDLDLRKSFVGFGDQFPGDGATWNRGDYVLEVLSTQPWHAGYKWGPVTRHHRDLGSSAKPLLQHSFAYAYQDPVQWDRGLQTVAFEDLHDLYNTPEDSS